MKLYLKPHFVWTVQFIGFCIAVQSPWLVNPVHSQELSSPFDGEILRLVVHQEHSTTEDVTENGATTETLKQIVETTQHDSGHTDKNVQEYFTETQSTISSTEETFDITVPPASADSSQLTTEANIDATKTENYMEKMTSEDILENSNDTTTIKSINAYNFRTTLPSIVTSQRRRPQYISRRQFPEPQSKQLKILNTVPSPFRFAERQQSINRDEKRKENEKSDESVATGDTEEEENIQNVIDEVTRFESFRISPKKRVPSVIREPQERDKQDLEGKINFLVPGTVISGKSYSYNRNSALPLRPKSSSEKISNFFKQKTLLEAFLTPDGASTRATNENAKPLNRRDTTRQNDTSMRNLLYPEGYKNIKRVTRSRKSEIGDKPIENMEKRDNLMNENTEKRDDLMKENITDSSFTNNKENLKQDKSDAITERSKIRGFKRPPRVLPIKYLPKKGESVTFVNSRERAKSLFNKSNEIRRKQVPTIIRNRKNPNSNKVDSLHNSSSNSREKED